MRAEAYNVKDTPGLTIHPHEVHASVVNPFGDSIRTTLRANPSEHLMITGSMQNYSDMRADQLLEAPCEDEYDLAPMISQARSFVEDTFGVKVKAGVRIVPKGNALRGGAEELAGYYNVLEGVVYTRRRQDVEAASLYLRTACYTKHLIHELTHSTSDKTRKIVLAFTPESSKLDYSMGSGMRTVDCRGGYPGGQLGFFFEESIAEAVGGRWKQQYDGKDYRDEELAVDTEKGKRLLAAKYITANYPLTWSDDLSEHGHTFSDSAFCAMGVEYLSAHTGVDLVQLMIDSRNPDEEVSAKRRFIQAIESVEKGLYKKLRDLPSSPEAFIEGYDEIQAAIGRSAIRNALAKKSIANAN